MSVHLVGSTEFELDTLAACAYDVAQLDVNRPADTFAMPLSDHERLISALIELRGTAGPHKSVERRLRDETLALRFLTYQFLFAHNPALDPYIQSSCLESTRLGAFVMVQGTLQHWINAMYFGCMSPDKVVVNTFCSVYLYLENVIGLKTVLSRFYKDTVMIDDQQLFRLRHQ